MTSGAKHSFHYDRCVGHKIKHADAATEKVEKAKLVSLEQPSSYIERPTAKTRCIIEYMFSGFRKIIK